MAEEQVEGRWVGQGPAYYQRIAYNVLEPFQLCFVLDLNTNLDDHEQGSNEERAKDTEDEDDGQKQSRCDKVVLLRVRTVGSERLSSACTIAHTSGIR
jgi:hypothetical protein